MALRVRSLLGCAPGACYPAGRRGTRGIGQRPGCPAVDAIDGADEKRVEIILRRLDGGLPVPVPRPPI
jgi:hypothetical protein